VGTVHCFVNRSTQEHMSLPGGSSKRALRVALFMATFAGTERTLTFLQGGQPSTWNYLTGGAVASAVFGFAAGQLRRGMLVGAVLSLVGLPLYTAMVDGSLDRLADFLARKMAPAPPTSSEEAGDAPDGPRS
jgi:hypothetical protein